MPLERDIIKRIQQTFPPRDASRAIELLTAADKHGRIARCIVFLAGVSVECLAQLIQAANEDDRDVISAAEYDWHTCLRDFRASFLIDAPEKMWIAGVAEALARRDYFLSSIDTVPLDTYVSVATEGSATFEGDLGPICVTKSQGRWTMKGDQTELAWCGLSEPLEDAHKFADAVSSYILGKRTPRQTA